MFAFRVGDKKGRYFPFYLILFFLFICLIILGYEYFSLNEEFSIVKKELKTKEFLISQLRSALKKQNTQIKKYQKEIKILKERDKLEQEDGISEVEDYLYTLEFEKKSGEEKKLSTSKKTLIPHIDNNFSKKIFYRPKIPKLAIIIDDVAFLHEIRDIKKVPFKITPSFFPPSKRHPDTYKFAKYFKFYMIHLPMEAYKFSRIEENTIKIKDSPKAMERVIKRVRKWFPKAVYINNHTGSKFTSDKKAMKELFYILKKYDFKFLDSKTSPYSKALIVAKEFNETIFSRDIFLDNIANVSYIKNQLRKAVKLAKKRGYAIAIGHPRRATLKALRDAKDILKGVDVVYVNEL